MIEADDTRSRSATDCLHWIEASGVRGEELAFWQYLAVSAQRYPIQFIPPFKRPTGKTNVRRIIGCHIGTRNNASGQPVPRMVQLYDGASYRELDVDNGAMGADVFADAALTKASRSAYFVFRDGGRIELRLIAQQWAQRLNELGYTVDVLMGGSRLKALIIKRGRHRWYLVCWESLTGLLSRLVPQFSQRTATMQSTSKSIATTVYYAAENVQKLCITWFGVGLSLTVSSTGLRAAARSLPEHVAKFKPLPMLVAMCRAGGGFRGGMVKGYRYRGPSWLVDLNRAYTSALRNELPWRSVLDRCEKNGKERHGIFMCRITGRAGLPSIYVGKWTGEGVETDWHTDQDGTSFLAILPSAEINGIRALGYVVRPGFGMVYVRTFTLAPFVEKIVQLCQAYGWKSPEARFTKLFGNSLYGKFAAPLLRRDLRISSTRPGKGWLVFVDEHGDPVEDLWERGKVVYQWSQHIDVAADITAHVRGLMYEAQADIETAGGQVAAMSTDAIVSTVNPCGILAVDPELLGAFKLADADTDGYVAGPNAYTVGQKAIIPDYPNPTRQDVVALFTESVVAVDTQRSGAPRPGAPLSWRVRKTISLAVAEAGLQTTKGYPPSRAAPS